MTAPASAREGFATRDWAVVAVLWLLTALIYAPVASFEYLAYDDTTFLLENPAVNQGLRWESVVLAFRQDLVHAWQPVATLSSAVNSEITGTALGGHLLGNALLHALNAALLYLLLSVLFRVSHFENDDNRNALFAFRSFVALLFLLHPLKVESVAWGSQRKDVLSAFFALLSLLAYLRYARRRSWGGFLLALACYGLALGSKITLAPLPLCLLLLDWWPLERWRTLRWSKRASLGIFAEKLPFFAVGLAAVLVSLRFAVFKGDAPDLGLRVYNAATSYWIYLEKLVWPHPLTLFYGYSAETFSAPACIAAVVGLVTLTLLVLAVRRSAPWLVVGWLWYLVALAPVSGFLETGPHYIGDRYAYWPHIGLYWIVGWLLVFVLKWPPPALRTGVALLLLAALGWKSSAQLAVWRDADSLYRHAIAVDGRSEVPHYNLGERAFAAGRYRAALAAFDEAARYRPDSYRAHLGAGLALQHLRECEQAIPRFERALEVFEDGSDAWAGLGLCYQRIGQIKRAHEAHQAAVRSDPGNAQAQYNLGISHFRHGRFHDALTHFRFAGKADPGLSALPVQLAKTYLALADPERAEPLLRERLSVAPDDVAALLLLAEIRRDADDPSGEVEAYVAILAVEPAHRVALLRLSEAQLASGDADGAVRIARRLVRAHPRFPKGHAQLQRARDQLEREPAPDDPAPR